MKELNGDRPHADTREADNPPASDEENASRGPVVFDENYRPGGGTARPEDLSPDDFE